MQDAADATKTFREVRLEHPEIFDQPFEVELAPLLAHYKLPPFSVAWASELLSASVRRAEAIDPDPLVAVWVEACVKSGALTLATWLREPSRWCADTIEPTAMKRACSVVAAIFTHLYLSVEGLAPDRSISTAISSIDSLGGSVLDWWGRQIQDDDSGSQNIRQAFFWLRALHIALWVPSIELVSPDASDLFDLIPVEFRTPALVDMGQVLSTSYLLTTYMSGDFVLRFRHLFNLQTAAEAKGDESPRSHLTH